MKITYTFDSEDWCDALKIEGDTDAQMAVVTVRAEDVSSSVDVNPRALRELATALLEVADRLEPPEPSLAVQLDRALRQPGLTIQSGFPGYPMNGS